MGETKEAKPTLSLYKKMLEVRKTVTYLQKVSQGAQYKYTGSAQVLGAVRAKMDEVGLLLTIHVNSSKVTMHEETVPKLRITYFTELDLIFTWIDAETGQSLSLGWAGQGIDLMGERGIGKALTYAEKYFILKQFNIGTDKDDPDQFQEKNQTEDDKQRLKAEAIDTAIAAVNACKSAEEVAVIWKANPDLKQDLKFKAAVTKMGDKYKKKDAPASTPAATDGKSE